MATISQTVNIEMLEKLPDGTYKKKNPATVAGQVTEDTNKKFMTDAEKSKLTAIAANANNYSHPTSHPASMITGLPTTLPANGGNASTTTKLQTARKINGVSFDGTADITVEDATKEPAFTKNTAFNKNFGTASGTVCQGNDARLSNARTPVTHTHTKSQITDMPTKLSQLIDDIGASGGEQGALIFDKIAAQQGTKTIESVITNGYLTEVRLVSGNKLLVSKTESRSGTSYITVIKVYADNGTTVKQTITITESKDTSGNYITTIT